MLSGDFERKLRKLNKNMRIWCGGNSNRPAGIYYVTRSGDYTEVCGIDKNFVPEFLQWNEDGSIRKGGWRRALKILISKGFIERRAAEREFSAHLEYAQPKFKAKSRVSFEQNLESMGLRIIERREKTK